MAFYKGVFSVGLPGGCCKKLLATTPEAAELLHIPDSIESLYDIITLYAVNLDVLDDHVVTLVLPDVQGGMVTVPIKLEQGQGWYPILPALRLGSGNAMEVKAYADTSNMVGVIALVDRLSQ